MIKWICALLVFFTSLYADPDAYSQERIEGFYFEYLNEQVGAFQSAGLVPTPGLLGVTIINTNKAQADDSNVWIVALGKDPTTSAPCFVRFDTETGVGTRVPATFGLTSEEFSYSLSQLPMGAAGRFIQMPYINSGRIYFSIGRDQNKINYFLDLLVNSSNQIVQPNPLLTTDPNYYILYDKVEFTFPPDNKQIAINTTAVDFFCLPLVVTVQETMPEGPLQVTGFEHKRTTVFTQLESVITTNDMTGASEWSNLFSDFNGSPMRVSSPKNAMTQADASHPSGFIFPPLYLQGGYGYDWITAAWKTFYADTGSNFLYVDATEKSLGIWGGQVDSGAPFTFNFTQVGTGDLVTVALPSDSFPFFAGAQFTTTGNADAAKIIVRDLTAAFDSGLFPLNTTQDTPLSKSFFVSQQGNFYKPNSNLAPPPGATGPWYDLYSKAIHSFKDKIYAFAFDDVLGLDGTTTSYEKNVPRVTITLLSMEGSVIPDPYTDPATYTITPQFPPSQTDLSHEGTPLVPGTPFMSTIPCVIDGVLVGSTSNTANIYVQYPLVRPAFNGSDGIIINDVTASSATIIFPAP